MSRHQNLFDPGVVRCRGEGNRHAATGKALLHLYPVFGRADEGSFATVQESEDGPWRHFAPPQTSVANGA